MKDKLTKEESAHLISLGVPKEKASDYTYTESNEYRGGIELPPVKVPIFTLTDLLEILPKKIDHSKFYMIWNDGEWDVGYCHYYGEEIYPESDLDFDSFKSKEELIDSLYELCVWCIENGYLKF